jgi:hypothetical protein
MNHQVFIRLFLLIATIFSTADPMIAYEDKVEVVHLVQPFV